MSNVVRWHPLIELLTESFDVDLMFEAAMALSSLDEKEACGEFRCDSGGEFSKSFL